MHDILNEPIQTDKPITNKSTVRIVVLIDESGSMLAAAEATVNSANSYLDEQATNDEPTLVSLYTFNSNTGVSNRFRSVNAKEAPRLKRNNDLFESPNIDPMLIYAPKGGTPLFDAMASVISEETTGTPTLVAIISDGYENASKEYPRLENIQALIKKQEDDGWTFTYLMAGLSREEAVAYTSTIMNRAYDGATMSYEKGTEDVAVLGLVSSTNTWSMGARAASATGARLDAKAMTKNFYAAKDRDIKKKK